MRKKQSRPLPESVFDQVEAFIAVLKTSRGLQICVIDSEALQQSQQIRGFPTDGGADRVYERSDVEILGYSGFDNLYAYRFLSSHK